MAPKVKPHRRNKVKQALLKNHTYKEALISNGYSKMTARNGKENKVIQEALDMIARDFKKEQITVDSVLKNLERLRILSEDKGDYSTATRVEELKGKYLAMFTDRQVVEGDLRQNIEIKTKLVSALEKRGISLQDILSEVEN